MKALATAFAILSLARAAAAADVHVTIDNFTFNPPSLTVAPETRVIWVNRDDIPHTVVSADDPHVMRSQPLDTGDQFAFVFHRPGTYRYFCSIHPHMQGKIIVH